MGPSSWRLGLPLAAFLISGVVVAAAQKRPSPKPVSVKSTVVVKKPPVPIAGKSALDKSTLEAYVRHLFVWGPQIQVQVDDPQPSPLPGMHEVKVTGSAGEARLEQTFYVSRDGQRIVQGQVYDVKENPFKADLDKLRTGNDPSLGSPGAPVVLVLFTDFQCPYCKEEAKMLRQNLISAYPKEVRLYFKDFPLEPIHPWAKPAAIAGRCIYGQSPEAFWDYHDWVFENQASITPEDLQAKVLEFAQKTNVDSLQLKRCMETKATEPDVNRSIEEGKSLRVGGTPTLFINGRRIASQLSWTQLRGIIDFEIDYQKSANNAGDSACCEVTLPSPLGR